jgi:hypothetical protein
MSSQVGPTSRRGVFVPHIGDRARLRCCPICQWAIDRDHAEALAMPANTSPAMSQPSTQNAPERDAAEAAAVVAFALV